MFFPQLMNIRKNDLVLEIGPGAYPFWRSDCLADIIDPIQIKKTTNGELVSTFFTKYLEN